jgi:hypothetical protein
MVSINMNQERPGWASIGMGVSGWLTPASCAHAAAAVRACRRLERGTLARIRIAAVPEP